MEGGLRADLMLIGGALGLIPVLVVAVTFVTASGRRALVGTGPPGRPGRPGRLPAAEVVVMAAVMGAVAFVTGLVASAVVVPAGLALLRANDNPTQPLTLGTGLRVIVGHAALTAASAVLAVGLAALVKRAVVAGGLAIALVIVPYFLAVAGLAPWLLVITPAAGFAITQSVPTFAHVDVPQSLLGGYYPLPPWAGLAVACGYAAITLAAASRVRRRCPG
ncbi:hypothetical protein [Nonomuraea salmonea]|uniref:hypothetical protein n=1 Tax=Nonomuraea salmonea TaxID=46181 RepID=UPI002FECDA8F